MDSPQVLPPRWALALALLFLATPSASEEAWRVRVDCPELDAEARAQLEVRHLVELQALPGEPRTLVLACSAETVEGRWERNDQVISRRSVTRTPDDDVLELAHWMASVLIGVGSEKDATVTGEVAVERADREPEEAEVSAPAREPESPPQPAASKAVLSTAKNPTPSGSSRGGWELGLGAGYQHYGTQIAGSLGPVAQGSWHALRPIAVGGALGYRWGLGATQDLSVEEGALSLHAGVEILDWLGVFGGPSATLVTFRGSDELGGKSARALTAGGELLVRAETPGPGWGGFVALGLTALLPKQEVRLDGKPALELPMLRGGLTLGLRYEKRR